MSSRTAQTGVSVEELGEAFAKVIERAHSNGGAAARATVDAQNAAIRTLQGALESREAVIKRFEDTTKQMLQEFGELVKTNSELAVAQSRERVAKMQLEAETGWRKELIELLGPGIEKAIPVLINKAIGASAGDEKLLKGDGTKEGDGRAALWAAVMFIAGRADLQDAICEGIGRDKWSAAIAYLQTQQAATQADTKSRTNGATN